jgi:hypothetical protein
MERRDRNTCFKIAKDILASFKGGGYLTESGLVDYIDLIFKAEYGGKKNKKQMKDLVYKEVMKDEQYKMYLKFPGLFTDFKGISEAIKQAEN